MVKVNFAFGATGTAEGSGVNNKLGTAPGLSVGVIVLVLVAVGEGVGVRVKVGAGDGLDVLVGARTTMRVGVYGVATTMGAG